MIISFLVVFASGIWAFWNCFNYLFDSWNSHPDYSHGFLVPPIAIILLYARRSMIPPVTGPHWFGCLLLILGTLTPLISELIYVESLGSWGLILWGFGACMLFYGRAGLKWAWPSIVFLAFMIPLPFRVEHALSLQLQSIATSLSCWILQLLGQPAFAEGHTIWLNERNLEVAQACSGLRIFVAIIAMAFIYLITTRTAWWEKVIITLGIIPVALISNATRIVVTGLLYQLSTSELAEKFSHDASGFAMIPFAALLFWILVWYLKLLFPEVEYIDRRQAVLAE